MFLESWIVWNVVQHSTGSVVSKILFRIGHSFSPLPLFLSRKFVTDFWASICFQVVHSKWQRLGPVLSKRCWLLCYHRHMPPCKWVWSMCLFVHIFVSVQCEWTWSTSVSFWALFVSMHISALVQYGPHKCILFVTSVTQCHCSVTDPQR